MTTMEPERDERSGRRLVWGIAGEPTPEGDPPLERTRAPSA